LLLHEPDDALAADEHAVRFGQLSVDARAAVGRTALLVRFPDEVGELLVLDRPRLSPLTRNRVNLNTSRAA
jgi:hypothetical protein